jgi:DNA-binding response OmpR family regulator/DNA-binding CsgD family transcriptional regulator
MRKVLIIEDDEKLRRETCEALILEGFEVYQSNNCSDGVTNAIKHSPHIILYDIMIPEMDGIEALAKFRKNEKTKTIPCIFITSVADSHSIRAGMDLGSDDYLIKPFTIKELANAINLRLDKYFNYQLRNELNNIENIIKTRFKSQEALDGKQKSQIEKINVENSQLSNQLKEKEAELLEEVLKAIETNNILQGLIKQLEDEITRGEHSPAQKKFFTDLKFKTKMILSKKNSWRIFQLKFNQVFPGFIGKIVQYYPNLTPLQLTLVSTILFNLNTNQIAGILNISPDSVRKSRYRLKKKINLGPNESLMKYIHEFQSENQFINQCRLVKGIF